MRLVILILALAVFAASAYAIDVGACQNLNVSGAYVLNQSVSINGSSCFFVSAENVSLDCNGYSITGNNSTSTFGVRSGSFNTTVMNCVISQFSVNIYLIPGATFGTIVNNTLTDMANGVNGAGISLYGANDNLVASNTIRGDGLGIQFMQGNVALRNRLIGNTITMNTSSATHGIMFELSGHNDTTIDCQGRPIIGKNASNTYGIYATSFNTTIRNCNVSNFATAIYLDGSLGATASNWTIENVTAATTYAFGSAIYLDTGNFNTISGSSGTAYSGYGITIQSSSNNIINNFNATSFNSEGESLSSIRIISSNYTTIANSTLSSDTGNPLSMAAGSNSQIYNNTFRSTGGTSTLAIVASGSSGNTFYWNNFTATTGKYVNDTNGSNFYNTSISGQPAGNMWANVLNGSVQVLGNVSSPFPGLYYGSSGSGYPYNSTTSQGRLAGPVIDFAPLTYQQPSPPPASGTNGSISGYVLYANNSTAAGASVFLNGSGLNRNTTTNASGYYNFSSLNYTGAGITIYDVRAQNPANNSSYSNYMTLGLNASNYIVSQNLTLSPSGGQQQGGGNGTNGSIRGTVFWPYGGQASGVNVSLFGASSASTTTNSSGSFTFSNLSWPAGYGIQARMGPQESNFVNLNLDSSNYNNVTQNLTLMEPGSGGCTHNGTYSVSGYVRFTNDSGTFNITGSPVQVELKVRNATCTPWDFSCFYEGNQSNNSGFYNVGCLEAGNYTMQAFGGGGPNQTGSGFMMEPTNITITNASLTDLNLNLTRDQRGPMSCGASGSIHGYITDTSSNPLSGVQVFAGVADFSGSGGSGGGSGNFCGGGGQTDSSGLYNITGLSAGTYMLNVMPSSTSGFAEVHLDPSQAIVLGTNSSSYQKNFTLSRSGFVAGYVYGNNSGTLVALSGAFVNIYSTTMGGAWGGGQTNGSGFFNISMTPGSGYELNVNPPYGSGYSNGRLSPFEGNGVNVTSGATTNVGNITLRQGARITGYVVNSTGQGIPNVGVNAHPKYMFGSGGGGEWAFTQTNGSGYFSLAGLKANSTYQIDAFPFDPNSNYSTGSAEVTVSDAGSSLNITLVRGNSVSGRVTCSGANVSFAPVNFMKVDTAGVGPDKMFGSMEAGSFAWAMTDQNGLYSVRGISAGNFNVRVELPWGSNAYNCSAYTNDSYAVAGEQTLNISLSAAVVLSGKVNDTNGQNVSGAFVNAFQPSSTGGPGFGPSAFAQTDSNGNYQLRLSTSATPYIVSIFPPWGSTYAQQEQSVVISGSRTLNFTLSSGGSIRGKVADSSGAAIQYAGVNAFSENARSFGFTNTLSDGTFEVRGLSSASDFRLFIQPPPTTGGIVSTFLEGISVASGQATDIGTITATSATSYLEVTVLDGASGVSAANVHAWRPFTPYFGYCTTNSSGQCNITGLTTGTYDVFVDSGGRPPMFTNATLASGGNSLTFNYNSTGAAYTLNGTVQNSTGGGIGSADVGIWDEATRFGMHTTANGSGFFSFTGVPSGTYKLGARKGGYFDNVGSVTVSANATQNITLTSATASGGSLVQVSGWLSSASGSSVATKSVVIVDAANASLFSDFTVTNSSGYYAFTSVPAPSSPSTFTYNLVAVLGNQTFNATQSVSAGANYTVNITVS